MTRRELFLGAFTLCGAATVLLTEGLSAFAVLYRGPLLLTWLAVAAVFAFLTLRYKARWTPPALKTDWFCVAVAAAVIWIAGAIAYTAWLSPPNSADAMAYHLPRVVYWAQQRSVAFFATPYLNQIMLQPFAEYAMLHTYLLSGGDGYVNFIQWSGFVGSAVGVSSLAAALGLSARGQAWAALFCATLPNGILQASGAKNDYLLAAWLVTMAVFLARWAQSGSRAHLWLSATALALAMGTKGTAYLFAPFLVAAVVGAVSTRRRQYRALATAMVFAILLLNGPQYTRNFDLSGSPLGFDSAHGDGLFRWRNESPGWRALVSNAIRNTSEQLGGRSAVWNRGVYDTALRLHALLGLNPQDPATTWRWAEFVPPKNANHEADANNRWHLLVLVIALAANLRRRQWMLFALGPAGGFLALCFYLKWQPFLGRLELPLFAMAAPLAAAFLDRLRPAVLAIATALFLLSVARLPLMENWTRPLRGPRRLQAIPREQAYFNDMVQWNNRGVYLAAVDRVTQSGCRVVGIDARENQLEYPLQALLLARDPAIRFVHTQVGNASAKYETTLAPCIGVTIGK